MALTLLMFWRILGFPLAWEKGAYGARLEWIGAVVELEMGRATITITERKRKDFEVQLRALLETDGKVSIEAVRATAGRASWFAGLFPQLRPFVRQLWAATSQSDRGPYSLQATDQDCG
eukprot:4541650-Amphidinium_carterae.1